MNNGILLSGFGIAAGADYPGCTVISTKEAADHNAHRRQYRRSHRSSITGAAEPVRLVRLWPEHF